MEETDNYFITDIVEEPSQQENSFLEGICGNCLDTGYKHIVQDGVLGVAYTTFNSDANGQPITRLVHCKH